MTRAQAAEGGLALAPLARLRLHPAARPAWDAWKTVRRRSDHAVALRFGEVLALRGEGGWLAIGGFDVLEAAEDRPDPEPVRVLAAPPLDDAAVARRAWFETLRLIGLQLDRRTGPASLLGALAKAPAPLSREAFGVAPPGAGDLAARLGRSPDIVSGRLHRRRGDG